MEKMIRSGDGNGPARETRACYVSGIHKRVSEIARLCMLSDQINMSIFCVHFRISTFGRGQSRAATFTYEGNCDV